MTRAFILVMDSFGVGATEDAVRYGDAGADTLGHIAAACSAGQADRAGLRAGPLRLPNLARLGLGLAASGSTGRIPAGLETSGPIAGAYGHAAERSVGKDTPSGHWEIAGLPVPFDWGLFPAHGAVFSGRADRSARCSLRSARDSRRLPCLGHGDHRGARRGASPHRQADLLHLGGHRVPDRRA